MTSPDFASRLTTAGNAVGTNRPQLAATLASSGLSHGEIGVVGGFASALDLQVAQNLAQDSGAKTNFSDAEVNAMAGIGDPVALAKQQQASPVDSRSWLEKATGWVGGALSNTGSALVNNPFSQGIFHALSKIGDAAHLPFRLISDAVDSSNDSEIDKEMRAQHYDPNSTLSYLQFMLNQGESQYHNLDAARNTYGDDLIDKIIQQQADPEQFAADWHKMAPDAAKALGDQMNSAEWQHAFEAVDSRHISPGRDLARILTLGHTNHADGSQTGVFTFLSGSMDAAYSWFADPTLILGKGVQAARMMDMVTGDLAKGARWMPSNVVAKGIDSFRGGAQRERIANILDGTGIEKALDVQRDIIGKPILDENDRAIPLTNVGKGWQSFLDKAKALREQHAIAQDTSKSIEERQAAIRQRAAIYRGMASQYGKLMPLLEEINGTRVISEADKTGDAMSLTRGEIVDKAAKPIENLDELASYMKSKAGLIRFTNGVAARAEIIMPGRLSYLAETRASIWGSRAARWIDYSKPNQLLPDASEIDALANVDLATEAGKAQYEALRGQKFGMIRQFRARTEQKTRRLTTLLPNVKTIDLTDANSSRLVEQIGRTYLNRGDSAKLASAYVLSGVADRRAIVRGLLSQVFEASGLSRNEGGRAFMEKYIADQATLDKQLYGHGDTSLIDTERGKVQAALYPDQLSNTVTLPSFRQMNYLAVKHAVGAWSGREGLGHFRALAQSSAVDKLMAVVKMGWITSAAGGLRNALDEMTNFAVTGLGRDALAGRAAFSKANQDLREERRILSQRRVDMSAKYGRDDANKMIGDELGAAGKTYTEATRQLQQAQNAEQARADFTANLAKRVDTANARIAEHSGNLAIARANHKAALDARAPDEELATLKASVDNFRTKRANAKAALRKATKDVADPTSVRAAFDARLADVPSVADAQRELNTAEDELRRAHVLGTAIQYRVPLWLRKRADNVHDLMVTPVLGKLISHFGPKYTLTGPLGEQRIKWAAELTDAEVARTLKDGVFQTHFVDDSLDFASDNGAMDLHRAGLKARRYAYTNRSDGWGQVEPDGGAGLDAWAKTMQLRWADEKSPAHAWVQTVAALHRDHTTFADEGMRLYRIHEAGAAKLPSQRPHGLYLSHETKAFRSPHADNYEDQASEELRYRTDYNPGHPEVLSPPPYSMSVKGLRGPDALTVPVDAGVAALRHLLGPEEFRTLVTQARKGKEAFAQTLRDMGHTDVDWNQYYDSYEQLMALGAIKAKEAGYKAIWHKDRENPNFSEYVALHDDVLRAEKAAPPPMNAQEWQDVLLAAKQSIRGHVDEESMRHFVDRAEVFHQVRGGEKVPLDQLKDEYADRLSADLIQTLGRQNGDGTFHVDPGLLQMLARGEVPDRSWLAQLAKEDRPEHTIGQLWAPYNAAHDPLDAVPSGYMQLLSHAYDKVVTDQIDALSRNPLVAALYMRARENLMPYVEHLKAAGWGDEAANGVAKQIAANHAQDEAFKHIDNPYVASQFSMVARNWFAFVRAQEDWLRRWGRTIRDNPRIIREAQLLIHGGTSTGIVEKDPNDPTKLSFIYPGSGLALSMFDKLFGAHDMPNQASIPMTGELTSSLTMLNPSLDNPIGFSGTPLISLPLHALTAFLGPDHAILTASLDKAVNGDLGAGREWWENMLPSWANRLIGGVISHDPASKYGAAYAQGLANLDAAGALTDPKLQTATGKAHLQHALGVQTRNALIGNLLFGFFAPAAPSYEGKAATTAKGFQGTKPDWSAHVQGLGSLKDEARKVFAELPYDKALAWWAKVHPNELIYESSGTSSRTQVGTEAASAPATLAAASYLERNVPLFDKYGGKGGVAAYFIPQGKAGTVNGSYSDVAYRAQLEYGIRDYKSLDQYFDDIITARGMSQYFAAKDTYDQAKTDAIGDRATTAQLDADWAIQKSLIEQGNPMLAERLASYAANNANNGAQISQLNDLVRDTDPEIQKALGANRVGVAQLLQARGAFSDAILQLGNGRGNNVNTARQQVRDTYTATVQQVALDYPGLADMIRGVFRLP